MVEEQSHPDTPYWKYRERILAWRHARYPIIRDRILKQKHDYYENHKAEILAKHREYVKNHKKETKVRAIKWKAKVKLEVLIHYSAGTLSCIRCGYSDIRALSIDHVNGGGHQHRAEIKGYHIYHWLRKEGYPEGYQVLCMNCQFIKMSEEKEYGKWVGNTK